MNQQPQKIRVIVSISVAIAMVLSTLSGVFFATPASAASDTMVVTGHGWGHGRGMGQYGALGYARQGWSSAQILNHFYSNTTSGSIPSNASVDPDAVRVNLLYMSSVDTTVDIGSGTLVVKTLSGNTLWTITNGKAVRLVRTANGFNIQSASSCSGPFTTVSTSGASDLRIVKSSSASGSDGLLQVCSGSQSVWVDGYVETAQSSTGYDRTVNVVSVDEYLRGVVPNESPAYWDMAALEAQAVAARSYVMAGDTRYQPYADTCDTARCQVYDGVYTTRGGSFRAATQTRTDTAIENTTGIVRRTSSGAVARTEFSSSTGGYTVGGAFPAVQDLGDSISSNPNHDWSTTVNLSTLDKYGKGRAEWVEVTKRNGLGEDGGRATEVVYTFPSSTLTVSGDQARLDFGLKSDWFTFMEDIDNVDRSQDAFVTQAFKVFTGSEPTSTQLSNWRQVALDDGRKAVSYPLAQGDYFSGSLVNELYKSALGRGADSKGRSYWVGQMKKGLDFEQVGTYFYASSEYYSRSGGTNQKFIEALYNDLLQRDSDSKGKAYWSGILASGKLDRSGVVEFFYKSEESRIKRTRLLFKAVTGSSVTVSRARSGAARLEDIDGIELAAEIAAGAPEFLS